MNLLLDTHAFIWCAASPDELSPESRRAIEDGSNLVFVSAASIWEISIKQAKGKLRLGFEVVEAMERFRFRELPVRVAHAIQLSKWPQGHTDPFDRMLAAQAMHEDLVLVSRDPKLSGFGIRVLKA